MAVSRAEKQIELALLEKTFRQVDTAVLIDYKGITVPQVTELRRQIRAAGVVTELASLPSKPELYAKLLYVLNAPAQGLVTVLSGVQRGLVTALGAYADKKGKE